MLRRAIGVLVGGLAVSLGLTACVEFLPFDETRNDPIAIQIDGDSLLVVSCKASTIKTLFIDVRSDDDGPWIKYLTATGIADVGPAIPFSAESLPEGLEVRERADRPLQAGDTIDVTMVEEGTGRTIGAEFIGTSPPNPIGSWLRPDGSIVDKPC